MTTEVWAGNQGTLCVYVSKAKDLPNLSKLDKQNVMLRLRIAHMTRESDTLLRAGQNPVFKYLERYEITPEVKPIMQVEVYCDRKKKAPILIGRCDVDLLNGIRADPKEGYCSWYDLKRERNEFAGTIFIELTFTPSLPHFESEARNEEVQKLDASMRRRPVPPLPGDSITSMSDQSAGSSSEGHYMHASVITETTPRIHSLQTSYSIPKPIDLSENLSSSIGTHKSLDSQETSETGVTTTSDTKFHFANLKRLKERINVFKNPNNSANNYHSETPVDIIALQKAIGVSSDDHDDDDSDGSDGLDVRHSSRTSRASGFSKMDLQPPLPPLPTDRIKSRSPSPTMPPLPRVREHTSPSKFKALDSPSLPPLPTSPASRSRTASPRRRPPPAGP